jgi:hypothetical protein
MRAPALIHSPRVLAAHCGAEKRNSVMPAKKGSSTPGGPAAQRSPRTVVPLNGRVLNSSSYLHPRRQVVFDDMYVDGALKSMASLIWRSS